MKGIKIFIFKNHLVRPFLIFSFLINISDMVYCQKNSSDILLFNFEDGSLKNWVLEGENPFVGKNPIHADQIKDWSRKPIGYQGKYYLETGANAGRHQNNPDGRVTSPEFKINRKYFNFYLGGEVQPSVRVGLLLNDTVVRETFGNNFYDFLLRGWDVSEFKNRKARFFIEDRGDRFLPFCKSSYTESDHILIYFYLIFQLSCTILNFYI